MFSVGETDGFETADVKPDGDDVQLYVRPAAEAEPMVVDPPAHITLFIPAVLAGNGLTVTTTVFVFTQPVAVMVSVSEYVVVTVGETVGLDDVEVKPAGDDVQEYVLPATAAAPTDVDVPAQTVLGDPALAAGNGLTVTVTLFEAEQPVALMVSTRV